MFRVISNLVHIWIQWLWQDLQPIEPRGAGTRVGVGGYVTISRHCSQSVPGAARQAGGPLNLVSFAGGRQPMENDLALAVHELALYARKPELRSGVGRICAGEVLHPVGETVAVRIRQVRGVCISKAAEELELPIIGTNGCRRRRSIHDNGSASGFEVVLSVRVWRAIGVGERNSVALTGQRWRRQREVKPAQKIAAARLKVKGAERPTEGGRIRIKAL